MNLLKMRIVVDTIQESNISFDVNLCVGFTVINKGATSCTLHYNGGPALMTIESGTSREFPGHSGYTYFGEMQVKFQGGTAGSVEVVKSIASTEES